MPRVVWCAVALAVIGDVSVGVPVSGDGARTLTSTPDDVLSAAVARAPGPPMPAPAPVVPVANITLSCDRKQWGPYDTTYCVATSAAAYLTL